MWATYYKIVHLNIVLKAFIFITWKDVSRYWPKQLTRKWKKYCIPSLKMNLFLELMLFVIFPTSGHVPAWKCDMEFVRSTENADGAHRAIFIQSPNHMHHSQGGAKRDWPLKYVPPFSCMSGAEHLTVLDSGIKGGGNIEGQVKFSVIWSLSPSESLHTLSWKDILIGTFKWVSVMTYPPTLHGCLQHPLL